MFSGYDSKFPIEFGDISHKIPSSLSRCDPQIDTIEKDDLNKESNSPWLIVSNNGGTPGS